MALLLFILVPSSVFAEPVSLEQLLRRTGATFRWDPWRHIGQLSREDSVLVFRPDDPWMVFNGEKLIVSAAVLEERGWLIFSEETAATIYRLFNVDEPAAFTYRLSTILIDPGHGGRDSGAGRKWPVDEVIYPLSEKNIVLELSLRIAEELRKKFPDKQILLTRENDVYPTLEERVAMANRVQVAEREAMIYLSIHANASLNSSAEGYEVWYLPQDYRRNLVDPETLGVSDSAIAPIINTLWEEEFTHESTKLADMILSGLEKQLGSDIPNRGSREESWFVVRNTRMASVLVEVGFITHQAEATRLRQPSYLSRISKGIYNGIVDFVRYFENKEIEY